MITQAQLKNVLRYEPETGKFYWRECRGKVKSDDLAGTTDKLGYRCITIDKKKYLAHRLAWLYMNGEFPSNDIDHVNGNPSDNRISNLRNVTHKENHQNYHRRKRQSDSTRPGISGIKGIVKICVAGKYTYWRAQIMEKRNSIAKTFPHTEDGLRDAKAWRDKKYNEIYG